LDLECAMIAVPLEPDERAAGELCMSSESGLPAEVADIIEARLDALLAGEAAVAEGEGGNWFLFPLPNGGRPAGVCLLRASRRVVWRDAREETVLNSMLRAMANELDTLRSAEWERELSLLAGGLAHSVRNPLAGISTVAQLLRGRVGDDPSLRRCVDLMIEEADKVEGIMRDFLEYGSSVEPCFRKENAYRILTSALSDMRPRLGARNIRVTVSGSRGLPPVNTDADLLARAIRIIIANCVEGMPQGGALDMRLSAVRGRGSSGVEIAFADTGAGIEPGDEGRVLEPFFKIGTRRMGLRLVAARKFVERLGGTIHARPGKGLELAVTIPAAQRWDEDVTGTSCFVSNDASSEVRDEAFDLDR